MVARRSLPVIQVQVSRRGVLLLGVAAVGAACGPTRRPGTFDAPPLDLDAPGVEAPDAATPDTAVADLPRADTDPMDVGAPDVGAPDAGTVPDASPLDLGAPDVATPDVATPDVPPLVDLPAPDVPVCPAETARLGALTDFPLATWQLVLAHALIVGHDDHGRFAFSARCTHRGCIVDRPDARGASSCACHGSIFDGHGAVVQGPASQPLQHYELVRCGDDLFVTAREVGRDARLPR